MAPDRPGAGLEELPEIWQDFVRDDVVHLAKAWRGTSMVGRRVLKPMSRWTLGWRSYFAPSADTQPTSWFLRRGPCQKPNRDSRGRSSRVAAAVAITAQPMTPMGAWCLSAFHILWSMQSGSFSTWGLR